MQLKEFYERVLPAEGRFVLYQNKRNDFFNTLDELVAATERRIKSQGLYFATANYGGKFKVDDQGRKIPVRTQDNVLTLKAFRFDIDAGAEKFAKHPKDAYPTQREALTALVAWIKTSDLMPTLIVSSGEGLHVYWCLDQPADPISWHSVAVKLNAVGRSGGMRVDGGCTADTARVLRPVGTPHKNGKLVAVLKDTGKLWDFREFADKVDALMKPEDVEASFPARAPRVAKARSINDDVLAVESPPSSLARVAEHCAAVAEMRDKAGCVPEPHWRAVLGVAKYCEDGEAVAHEWSSGYVGYNERETQEKLDRWETPPTTCAHFDAMFEGCKTCKHRGKITTPKQLGYISIAVAPAPVPAAEPAPNLAYQTPKGSTAAAGVENIGQSDVQNTGHIAPAEGVSVLSGEDTGMNGSFALPDAAPEDATPDCPVPSRPDLFDDENSFFYKVADNRWTLYHRISVAKKDATGQTVYSEEVVPVAYKMFWVDSSSLPGASDTNGVTVQFGRVHKPGSVRQDRMEMPAGISFDIKALCKYLVDQGINVAPTSVNKNSGAHMQDYVQREMARKQNDMRFVIKERFGYHFHEGEFVCSMGKYTVYPDGRIMLTACNRKLDGVAQSLTTTALERNPSGRYGPDTWKQIAPHVSKYIAFLRKHYGHPGFEKARLAIAINLASPFLMFAADAAFRDDADVPSIGFTLSMYSEGSGIGKSSIMQVVAAAYGKNALARKGNTGSITPVAAATIAMNMAVYPFLLDEVTQNDAGNAAALIDTFANGLGRVRAAADGAVRNAAASWANVTTLATNVPQRELLSVAQKRSEALLMRLMELNFDDTPRTGDREAFAADLKDVQATCGSFGLFQALLAVRTGCDELTKITASNVTKAYHLLEVGQDFRFFARMLGAMLTAQQLLGRHAPFDMDDLVAAFKAAIKDTLWYVAANKNTPVGDLSQLLNHVAANVAVTKTWSKRTGKDEGNADVLLNPNLRLPVLGREVQDWGVVYVDASAVREWCVQQQMSINAFVAKCEDANLLIRDGDKEKIRLRLTTGIMGLPTTMGYYYKFRTRPAEAQVSGDNVVPLHAPDETPAPELLHASE